MGQSLSSLDVFSTRACKRQRDNSIIEAETKRFGFELLHSQGSTTPISSAQVRRHEYDGMSAFIDLESLSRVADISVFITSQDTEVAETQTRVSRRIAVPVESVHLSVVSIFCSNVIVLLSCVITTIFGWVSSKQRETLYDTLDPSTLAGYTFGLRVAPVLIGALLAVFSSMVLLLVEKFSCKARHPRSTSDGTAQLANGDSLRCSKPQVRFSKPDLQQEMEREAELGPVHVQVCGPARMIRSVEEAAKELSTRNRKITLDIHDSAM